MSLGYVHPDLAPDEMDERRECADVLYQAADLLSEGAEGLHVSRICEPLAELLRVFAENVEEEPPDRRAVAVALAILGEEATS